MNQLPMFGITLISQGANRQGNYVQIEFRRAASTEFWAIRVQLGNQLVAKLSRPGACFALVELASVGEVESRQRF